MSYINSNQIINTQPLSSIDEQLKQLQIEKGRVAQKEYQIVSKALSSDNPNDIMKANTYWEDVQTRQSSGLKTELVDPTQWTQGAGYKYKRFTLSYDMMRRMVSTTPIIKSIIGTRQAQVSAFSSPQKSKFDTGFVVRKKRAYYSDEDPTTTAKDKKQIDYITKFLLDGGDKSNAWSGDTFDMFLKKLTADSLTLDQGTFEVVRNRGGAPVEYLAVDGATMRMADSINDDDNSFNEQSNYMGEPRKKIRGYYPSYVQVIDGIIENEYYPWELCLGIRNATTDIRSNGYGKSEIEELVSIITWMLYGDTYNGKFFSQGSSPKGMLKVASGVNRNRLNEFRQQWLAMVAGVQNAWKVPIVEGDVEWIDMQKGNKDMEFSKWQEYLIRVACAVFKIAPDEIGFKLDNGSGGLGGENDTDVKIRYSKDKGLKPLLKSMEFWINKWIVQAIDDEFEFKFVGLDQDGEDRETDLLNKKVGMGMGVKEWRKAQGLDPEFDEGDFPLNAVWVQQQAAAAFGEQSEDNTQGIDEGQVEDMWSDLGKATLSSQFTQYEDNPMMKDAMDLLLKG